MKSNNRHISIYTKYRIFIGILLFISILGLVCYIYYLCDKKIPKFINILVNQEATLDFNLPIEAEINTQPDKSSFTGTGTSSNTDIYDNNDENSAGIEVWQLNTKKLSSDKIKVTLNEPVTIVAENTGNYTVRLKLFGLITISEIPLKVVEEESVIACGMPVGIIMNTDGILILGTGIVTGSDGFNYENSLGKVQSGDYIIAVNDTTLNNKEELISYVQKSKGNPVVLTIRRNNSYHKVSITPVLSTDGDYKLGIWIRDDTQGIGTLTYITSTGNFGALGHGITDVDTGLLMDIEAGNIYEAKIVSIEKGKTGTPGELSGYIYSTSSHYIGSVESNTNNGIFGHININDDILDKLSSGKSLTAIPVGLRQDIVTGPAKILCFLGGSYNEYDINIDVVNLGDTGNKGIVFTVTDEELLTLTGGIVQGMSGSPIIQSGRLIGAVTHVFVSDPTKGYGIFIENMLGQ